MDPDWKPDVRKSETGLHDYDEGYSGSCYEGSSQVLTLRTFPIKQNPDFLEDLLDGFTVATKSESHDGLITQIKIENSENEDFFAVDPVKERWQLSPETVPSTSSGINSGCDLEGVGLKLEDGSTEGSNHESNHRILRVSSAWNPRVLLERIDLNLANASNCRTKSFLSCDLPSSTTQTTVENTEDENIAGPHLESACCSPITSSKWNPQVRLERINLTLMDVSWGTKSISSHDVPSQMTQIKMENTEDEVRLAGPYLTDKSHVSPKNKPSAYEDGSPLTLEGIGVKQKEKSSTDPLLDSRWYISPKMKPSDIETGSRFPSEEVGVEENGRPSKSNSVQKTRVANFDFTRKNDETALSTQPALLLNVTTLKSKDCSDTGTNGLVTDLDIKSNHPIEYHRGQLIPRPTLLSSEEHPGPSKAKLDVLAERGLRQVAKKKSSLKCSPKLMSEKKLQNDNILISCCICTKQVHSRHHRSHLRTHSSEGPFLCKLCAKPFKLKGTLIAHFRNHFERRPFSCKLCPARFKTTSNLNRHLLIHSEKKLYVCNRCSAHFRAKDNLKRHIFQTHSDERPFCCKQCPKRFKSKIVLSRHLPTHSNERPFSCEKCSARFKGKKGLIVHLRKHNDEKLFSCELCPRSFKTKSLLTTHSRVHSSGRPFSCAQCQSRFKSNSHLQQHSLSHSNERLFSCERCPARFKSRRYLTDHLLRHSDERPFSCEQCTSCFKTKGDLTRHLKIHSR